MAFLLKSTKLIQGLVSSSCQRGLIGRRKTYFFLQNLNGFDFNQSPLRTSASLAAADRKEKEFEYLQKSLFQLSRDVQNHNVFIEDIKDVFNTIKKKGEITYPQLILLLNCCSEVTFMSSSEERIKLAEEIWKTASEFGTKFHISHYNALLNVFLENNHKFSPSEFFTILETEGVTPNSLTYRRILRAYCQQGDIEGANDVLKKMKEEGLPMDVEDFNSLILGYCEAGDFKEACDTIKIMQEKDIDPTTKTYTYLLCGYARQGEIQKIKDLMKELQEKEIFLSDFQLLDLVYVLAVNGKTQHIDFVLQKLGNSFHIGRAADRIIQRLLHAKLDSVALRIFEYMEQTLQSTDFVINVLKKMLSHLVVYRSPAEVLKFCHKIEVKGWFKPYMSHVLRESFLKRNEDFCLKLLDCMRDRNIEIRSHYYWPIIIKASEKGNSHIFDVLKSIPRKVISKESLTTVCRIIFPNYQMSEDWRKDFDMLENVGFGRALLARCFAGEFLLKKQFDQLETLAANFPVHRALVTATYYAKLLPKYPEEANRFVDVVHYLAHDFHVLNQRLEKHTQDLVEEAEEAGQEGSEEMVADSKPNLNILDHIIPILSRHLKDEEVFRRVLEGLLEKQLPITPETASVVTKSLANEDLVNLVNKLASPELKFELKENLLDAKGYKFTIETGFSNLPSNVELLLKEMESLLSVKQKVKLLRNLVKQRKHQEAMQLAEHLPEKGAISPDYLSFVLDLHRIEQPDFAEKALNLGIQKGFLGRKSRLLVTRWLFSRGKTSEAVNIYCNYIEEVKGVPNMVQFLNRVVSTEDEEAIKKMLTTMAKYLPENYCLSHLTLALAYNGQLKKAKKLLESKNVGLTDTIVYSHINFMYKDSTAEKLENTLKILKELEGLDRIPLYKLLLGKYAKDNDVDKAKNLWLVIEEDDITNYDFLEEMREFINNPTVDSLKNLARKFETVNNSDPLGAVIHKKLRQPKRLKKVFSQAMREKFNVQKVVELHAAQGDVDKVIQLLPKYEHQVSFKRTAAVFLQNSHVREYLKFLNHCVDNLMFKEITRCFKLHLGLRVLQNDIEAFAHYKSLAIRCHEETGHSEPLLCCFGACICAQGHLTEAENILEKYSDTIKSALVMKLKDLVTPLEVELVSNMLDSDKIRSHFSAFLPEILSSLIAFLSLENRLKEAEDILKKAVQFGLYDSIDKDSLSFLEKKLSEKGKEVLESET